MLVFLPFAVSVVLSALSSSRSGSGPRDDRYGADLAGRRGPALWDGPDRSRSISASNEDEALQGHVFSSVSPAG